MNKSSRFIICIRDGACGKGGIHCECCNRLAKAPHTGVRTTFSRLIRTRIKNFINRDIARNPF
jgi:hypothetical protein